MIEVDIVTKNGELKVSSQNHGTKEKYEKFVSTFSPKSFDNNNENDDNNYGVSFDLGESQSFTAS
ncbi:MAG: hypothetical protein AAF573_12780 [Bacteroidota bacterium]